MGRPAPLALEKGGGVVACGGKDRKKKGSLAVRIKGKEKGVSALHGGRGSFGPGGGREKERGGLSTGLKNRRGGENSPFFHLISD